MFREKFGTPIDYMPFPFDGRGLVMALALDGYFDESERNRPQDGEQPISVAGYIFKPTAYKAFCRKWRRMLLAGPTPTTHFHMTHLYARSFEYDGWSAEQRAEVLRLAVEAIKPNIYCGVSVLFRQSEFERLAPPLWRFEHGSIYSAACQMVLQTTALWMDDHKSFLPIAYAFESGHRFWDEADDVLKGIGQFPEYKRRYRYRTHFPLDKMDAFGLQAADLLAWVMSCTDVGSPRNHTMRAFGPHLIQLVNRDDVKYQLFHPTGQLMERFFQENAKTTIVVDLQRAKKMRLR
jgi:hypothetical protein